jgi:hypothetical protein
MCKISINLSTHEMRNEIMLKKLILSPPETLSTQ